MITTDPKHPGIDKPSGPDGENEAYLVLSEEERVKGFVRPVRGSYLHLGRTVCGKVRNNGERDRTGRQWVCTGELHHEGVCYTWKAVSDEAVLPASHDHLLGGCGTVTTMGQALAETWARDVSFYNRTWCAECRDHRPATEFRWLDGGVLGS